MSSEKRYWIFIRGLGRHSGHWASFIENFKRHFPEDEIELLDLRGNGSLAHSPSWISVEENVRDLRSRSEFIRNGKHVYLMSISLGSMIATEWSHRHPFEIEGSVLINTSDRGTASFFNRIKLKNIRHFLTILKDSGNRQLVESEIIKITTNAPEMQRWVTSFKQMEETSISNICRQLLAAARYKFPEHKPKTEILILVSAKDQLVSSICSERIAKMWTLKTHRHPTAGHDLPLEDGDWVCRELKNWLEL